MHFKNMRPHDMVWSKVPPSSIVEPKKDGIRVHYYDGHFYTKRQKIVYGLTNHALALGSSQSTYKHIDCEATVPGFDFNTASGIIRALQHPLKYKIVLHVIDLPELGGDLLYRRAIIDSHFRKKQGLWVPMPYHIVHSSDEIKFWYHIYRGRGEEGIMIKNPHGLYVDCGNTRKSWDWQRWKPDLDFDAFIMDMEEGHGKFRGSLGVLIVKRASTGEIVRAGRGKLKDKEADHIFRNFNSYRGRRCSILYQRRNATGGYRHPRFDKWKCD